MKEMKDETFFGHKINLFVNNEIANLQNQFMEQKKKKFDRRRKNVWWTLVHQNFHRV
jgi:hypothetical protein